MTSTMSNPNRPTEPNYCAQCGEISQHADFGRCWTRPQPLTTKWAQTLDTIDAITALTDDQRIHALIWLSGAATDDFAQAMHYVTTKR